MALLKALGHQIPSGFRHRDLGVSFGSQVFRMGLQLGGL
jgi:hypothetical protein